MANVGMANVITRPVTGADDRGCEGGQPAGTSEALPGAPAASDAVTREMYRSTSES